MTTQFALELEFPKMTEDKYLAVMRELGLDNVDAVWPDGSIEHTAGPMEGGWAVFDVWESEAHWQRFLTQRLTPAFKKVGGISEPKVRKFEVHNRHARAA
jgi:hypothetical protein